MYHRPALYTLDRSTPKRSFWRQFYTLGWLFFAVCLLVWISFRWPS